jgi:hypothetical protein
MLIISELQADDAACDLWCKLGHVSIDERVVGALEVARIHPVRRACPNDRENGQYAKSDGDRTPPQWRRLGFGALLRVGLPADVIHDCH